MKSLAVPLRRPIGTGALYAALLLLGLAALNDLPLALNPDLEYPEMSATIAWEGASPEQVEALVTSRIEGEAQQLPGAREVSSMSGRGFGQVNVAFERGTRMDRAEILFRERLTMIREELPKGVSPPTIERTLPPEMQQGSFLILQLAGPRTPEALKTILDEQVKPRALAVPGVAGVEVYGGADREIRVDLKPEAIERGDVDVPRVVAALERAGARTNAGSRVFCAHRLPVVIERPEVTAAELGAQIVGGTATAPLRLDHVASVQDTWARPRSLSRLNGRPSVALVLEREAGTNLIRVAEQSRELIEEIRATLPAELTLRIVHDASESIRKELDVLGRRAAFSILCIFLVMVVAERRLRAPVVVLASVLFSAVITFLLFRAAGLGINLITMSGLALAFGMSVDNSIVLLETVSQRTRGRKSLLRTLAASREVMFPLIAATGTTAVVLTPFLYMTGNLRDLYLPFVLAICLSLTASLGVALTLTPLLSRWALAPRRARRSATGGRRETALPVAADAAAATPPAAPRPSLVNRFYEPVLAWTMHRAPLFIALCALIFAGSVWVFVEKVPRGSIFGGGRDTTVRVYLGFPPGTDIERTNEAVLMFENAVLDDPFYKKKFITRVESMVREIQGGIVVRFPAAVNGTTIPGAVKDKLVAIAATMSGCSVSVSGEGPGFSTGNADVSAFYTLTLRGPDYPRLGELAEDVGRRLARNGRVRDIRTNASSWISDDAVELNLVPDRERMSELGISMRDLVDVLQPSISGQLARRKLRGTAGEIDGRVAMAGGESTSPAELASVISRGSGGAPVRLGELMSVGEKPVQTEIRRNRQQYMRMVTFDYRGPSRVGNTFVQSFLDGTQFPPGYTIEEGAGVFLTRKEETQILVGIAAALVLIYMVSAALFESLLLPFTAILTVPLSFVGIALTFWAIDMKFDRTAYVGLILLAGVSVNNALLLVHRAGTLLRRSGDGHAAALRAAGERFKPILMTTATSVAGLVPLAWGSEPGAAESWKTLAISAGAGLVASAFFSLTFLPCLFFLMTGRSDMPAALPVTQPAGKGVS